MNPSLQACSAVKTPRGHRPQQINTVRTCMIHRSPAFLLEISPLSLTFRGLSLLRWLSKPQTWELNWIVKWRSHQISKSHFTPQCVSASISRDSKLWAVRSAPELRLTRTSSACWTPWHWSRNRSERLVQLSPFGLQQSSQLLLWQRNNTASIQSLQ